MSHEMYFLHVVEVACCVGLVSEPLRVPSCCRLAHASQRFIHSCGVPSGSRCLQNSATTDSHLANRASESGVQIPMCFLRSHPCRAGEVSSAILTLNGVDYLIVVGQHPRKDPDFEEVDGVTMIYNIAEETWVRGAKRPSVGDHHASEVIDNKMYLFGGLKLGQKDVQVGELFESNTGVDIKWEIKGSIPVPSGSGSSALIDGLVRSWS